MLFLYVIFAMVVRPEILPAAEQLSPYAAAKQKAANEGNARAQLALGALYSNGIGIEKDAAKAVYWYGKAAEQGDVDAQYALGNVYANGQGVPKDEATAVRWHQKAAAQGHSRAQFYLGVAYANGQGAAKDEAKAVHWYQEAAAQGHIRAQLYLGTRYAEGRGVPKDEAKAVDWLQKAASKGNADAQKRLDRMKAAQAAPAQSAATQASAAPAASTQPSQKFSHSALFPVGVNGVYGYVDQKGEWAITPRYDAANPFAEDGTTWVQYKGKYVRINAKGEFISPQFDHVSILAANGLARTKQNSKYGFIDIKGKWVIKPEFDHAFSFADNGLAVVLINGKYGFIDSVGQWVVNPQFDDRGRFYGDIIYVKKNNKWLIVNTKGEWIAETQMNSEEYDSYNSGLLIAMQGGKSGALNYQGEWIIPPVFQYIGDFNSQGVAFVKVNNMYGLINTKGEWVIPPVIKGFHPDADAFHGLHRHYVQGLGVGFVNNQSQVVIKPQFESASSFFENGLAAVVQNGKKGLINTKGQWVVKPSLDYVDLQGPRKGLLAASLNGKTGFIDSTGQWAIEPQFEGASKFSTNGLAIVRKNKKLGYIDTKGQWIIKPLLDSANAFESNGLAQIKHNGAFGCINSKGDRVTEVNYSQVKDLPTALSWKRDGDQRALVDDNGNMLLYLDSVCDVEIAKNAQDEIIWPRNKSVTQICEDKMAMDRYQRQKDAQDQAAKEAEERKAKAARDEEERVHKTKVREIKIRSCSHVYKDQYFYTGSYLTTRRWVVRRVMPEEGMAIIYNSVDNISETRSCSSIPRD